MMPSVVVTGFAYDYVLRLVFGGIVLSCIWVGVHFTPRDRLIRHLLPWFALVCALVLIHLPRMPGLVTVVEPTSSPRIDVACRPLQVNSSVIDLKISANR